MHKDLRPIVKELRKRGYTVEVEKGQQHLTVRDAAGNNLHSLPSTPGGGRWLQNLRSELRRKGLIE